ncbi:hypothetical protein RHGRI_008207 [Rhododendron griersonianum]|uniref:Uncharacterized protein n=1 Tax=Rhododendron griersonianum TaxID=479676 RepID=A0AAV6KZI5_9ERIC|nr:hypothetical protein RHGRI_008207 [Rhododendron griersonianum]
MRRPRFAGRGGVAIRTVGGGGLPQWSVVLPTSDGGDICRPRSDLRLVVVMVVGSTGGGGGGFGRRFLWCDVGGVLVPPGLGL